MFIANKSYQLERLVFFLLTSYKTKSTQYSEKSKCCKASIVFCTCIWKFTLAIHILRCRRCCRLSWSCWSSIIISVVISIICRCYRLWSFWFWFRLRLWFRSWCWSRVWLWYWNVVDWRVLSWIVWYVWYFVSFCWIVWIYWFKWISISINWCVSWYVW